ncbi:hypothetical protein BUALT_Bualt04G0171000 [Buddleja alternifolia]|uniref:DUF7950 domain-containing protein n=1 Tax=Buddleja alternifolia TaxID=168488 RepID=A0AAV6XWG5_9LAMI|nr:hypothetical protein BUALT_Bualt04G0171000 [Buddleja alternifolia]
MNKIMLRFRPIAPKPAGGDVASSSAEQERRNGVVKSGRRTKRKYVRVRGRQSNSKRKIKEAGDLSPPEKSGIEDESPPEKGAVTLQLLPERSESEKSSDNSAAKRSTDHENWNNIIDPYALNDDDVIHRKLNSGGGGSEDFRSVTETRIIVECVTDTYIGGGIGLGFSDREKINSLQMDTCPGFVSDGTNNVVWVNQAYREMVAEGEAAENGFMVRLVVKEKLPQFCPSFACIARLIQQRKHGHKWNRIVPCDVWRMEFAGFAWKLDVNTALSLGI